MTIDSLTMLVVDVLGKYIVDQGATLVKEAGQAAAKAASQLCELVLTRLKADPANAGNIQRFEKNPEGYRTPVADAIAEKATSDPAFAAQLTALIAEYQKAASLSAPSNINARSSGVATQGGIATGEGGVAVAGNVGGGITITNTQSNYSSGETGP
jgi:hypothetical protein